jgi:(R)-2-hydroxyacyl-CoA dehydratese activating ATPase
MFAGVDIGASSTDVVLIDENKRIVASSVIPTGANHKQAYEKALKLVCEKAGCSIGDIEGIVGTGYGRKNIKNIYHHVTEITCHAKGAHYFFKDVRTILDIGGQDSKVIKVDHNGNVVDFLMNEKCAAGTGRYLEAMARVLEVDISDMGELSLKSVNDLRLSSVCTVFAESEVISKIAEEHKIEDIINGIHNSVCYRAVAMLEKMKIEPEIVMTGGVAKNIGVINNLEKILGQKVSIPKEPQIIGATGAAIFALEKNKGKLVKSYESK